MLLHALHRINEVEPLAQDVLFEAEFLPVDPVIARLLQFLRIE